MLNERASLDDTFTSSPSLNYGCTRSVLGDTTTATCTVNYLILLFLKVLRVFLDMCCLAIDLLAFR
jgi:hypothetical protein